jgi:hypothetical protein
MFKEYFSKCCNAVLFPDIYTVSAWFCTKCKRHHWVKVGKGEVVMLDSYAAR